MDEFEGSENCATTFVFKFSQRILEELREFSEGCKRGAQKIKKMIVKVEDFYLKIKRRDGDLPLIPTLPGGE